MQKLKQIFLLVSLLALVSLVIYCSQMVTAGDSTFTNREDWKYAAEVAPPELMQQVVKENINNEWLGDPGRMKILKIQQSGQKMPLYLINSRVQDKCPPRGCDPLLEPLCGSAGCTYLGYIQSDNSYRQVFKQYLKSLLPPSVPFLRVSDRLSLGLPCLEFAELPQMLDGDTLRISRFCYDGQKYVLKKQFNTELLQSK